MDGQDFGGPGGVYPDPVGSPALIQNVVEWGDDCKSIFDGVRRDPLQSQSATTRSRRLG